MKRPRVLIAGLYHEIHTFTSGETTLAACEINRDDEIAVTEGDS